MSTRYFNYEDFDSDSRYDEQLRRRRQTPQRHSFSPSRRQPPSGGGQFNGIHRRRKRVVLYRSGDGHVAVDKAA